ncbi:hypothetical protein AB833_07610 [Chromatiales bacterium (ex Bugula neritina AB1)]|nr:hypothetical protein AB833_07610 [Chromatiales bacterium (ex Bugula neritina AB1)]
MKQSKYSSTLVAVVLSFSTATVFAQNAPALTDTDGNGVISTEEAQAALRAFRDAKVTEFDTDGDGQLSRTERRAARDARRAQAVVTFDTDGDGELSRAERQDARAARRDAIEAQFDTNNDGNLSDAERAGLDGLNAAREENGNRRGHGKRGRKNRDS